MTGNALLDFIVGVVVLFAAVYLFFIALPKMSPDATFTQIARIAVGVFAFILLVFAVKGVLFGGGGGLMIKPEALLIFAIGLIVALVVVYLLNMAVDAFLGGPSAEGQPGPPLAVPAKYVIGALAVIALLYLMTQVLGGGGLQLGKWKIGEETAWRILEG